MINVNEREREWVWGVWEMREKRERRNSGRNTIKENNNNQQLQCRTENDT